MATFNLQIVTPDKLFYNEDVDMLVVRTTEGDVGLQVWKENTYRLKKQ